MELGFRALRFALLIASLVLAVPGRADPRPAAAAFAGTCDVRFEATSTLHDFGGEAAPSRFVLIGATSADALDADVIVDARSLRTGVEARDARLRTMLDVERWPDIVGRFRGLDPAVIAATRRLPFTLTIRDVTRRMEARVTEWARGEHDVTLRAELTVSLRDFGLQPPSVLGLVRVGDEVRVRVRASVMTADAAG